jgi:hypothetical protein
MRSLWKLLVLGALVLVLGGAPSGCSKDEAVPAAEPTEQPAPAATEADAPDSPFTVTHEVSPNYTPGAALTVKTTMHYKGTEPVTALAIQTTLPQAWTYGGVQGELRPAIDPPAGTTGQVTLIWIQIPAFPATIEYTLAVPDWTEGTHTLTTQAIYRTLGDELKSPAHEVSMTRAQ